jgi:periplasmic nitrate reductase NapE
MATPNHSDPATATDRSGPQAAADSRGKSDELRAFIALTVFLAPALTAALVAILGFTIWISQMVLGPPGPQG